MEALRETERYEASGRKHALIVEDIQPYADFLSQCLSQDYEIVHATNLKDARVKAQKMVLNGGLDLVITDLYFPTFPAPKKQNKYESRNFYNEPEKNGNNFARFIRFLSPKTPIIGLSQEDKEFEQTYFNKTFNKLDIDELKGYQNLSYLVGSYA